MLELKAKPLKDVMSLDLQARVEKIRAHLGRAPGLAVVIVGENPASQLYVANKEKTARTLGLVGTTFRFPATVQPEDVKKRVDQLNQDSSVDGILIQRPLPAQFNESEVLTWVTPTKDVDAFHPETVGKVALGLSGFRPCTPAGALKLLDHYGLSVDGKTAIVIGRSTIVGKPLAQLLLQRDATVIHAHSKTKNLKELSLLADFVFVAIGKAKFIDASYLKKDAVVIDIGISKSAAGETVGDVDYQSATTTAKAVTPVPGGVGPMTIMILMENTLLSAELKVKNDA